MRRFGAAGVVLGWNPSHLPSLNRRFVQLESARDKYVEVSECNPLRDGDFNLSEFFFKEQFMDKDRGGPARGPGSQRSACQRDPGGDACGQEEHQQGYLWAYCPGVLKT
jgi:hypothetical protein